MKRAVTRVADTFVGLAAFFMAFDLSIAAAGHGLLSEYIGLGYLLVHPYSVLALGAILHIAKLDRRFLLLPVGLLSVGAVAGVLSSPYSSAAIASRYIWFGLISIAVGAAFVRRRTRLVVVCLVVGVSVWAAASLAVYSFSVFHLADMYPWLSKYRLDELIVVMRFPGQEFLNQVYYDEVIGNLNQAANRCILAIILLGFLVVSLGVRLRSAIALYVPVLLLLIVSFSRGALLVGLVLGIGGFLGTWMFRSRAAATAYAPLWVALILPMVLSFTLPALREGWGDLTTVETRVDQWHAEIGKSMGEGGDGRSVVERFFVGYGPGGYGLARFGQVDAGTHNLFLDVWFGAGVTGLIGLLLLFFRACTRALTGLLTEPRNQACLASLLGLAAIGALGFREYPLAYLYASGMEGLLLGIFAGLAFLGAGVREQR